MGNGFSDRTRRGPNDSIIATTSSIKAGEIETRSVPPVSIANRICSVNNCGRPGGTSRDSRDTVDETTQKLDEITLSNQRILRSEKEQYLIACEIVLGPISNCQDGVAGTSAKIFAAVAKLEPGCAPTESCVNEVR